MTKLSNRTKGYNVLSSGPTERANVLLPKLSKVQLKDEYNILLCKGREREAPPIVSREISKRLKLVLDEKSAKNSASLTPRREGR